MVEKLTGGANYETEETLAQLESVKFDDDTQKLYQLTYNHMLTRMKKDLISLQLRSNDLTESLHSKNQIYKEESNKQRLAKEQKL